MIESVFREIIGKKLFNSIGVQEAFPYKGKPAKKGSGEKTIWIVKASIGNEEVFLESARGGAREWASLNSLDSWLRAKGIHSYSINHIATDKLLQPQLFLGDSENNAFK